MIRLGSLAGYPFEGPRVLGGWTPPPVPAVYAVLLRPQPDRDRYTVIDVDESGDLTGAGLPFRHPRAGCWIARTGSRWNLYVCWYEVPGDSAAQRAEIVRQLVATYHPKCCDSQYDNDWHPTWLNDKRAPLPARPPPRPGPLGPPRPAPAHPAPARPRTRSPRARSPRARSAGQSGHQPQPPQEHHAGDRPGLPLSAWCRTQRTPVRSV
jgi:hypothetical protein